MCQASKRNEAEYEICGDQVKEELDLVCVVLEGGTKLSEVTKGEATQERTF